MFHMEQKPNTQDEELVVRNGLMYASLRPIKEEFHSPFEYAGLQNISSVRRQKLALSSISSRPESSLLDRTTNDRRGYGCSSGLVDRCVRK